MKVIRKAGATSNILQIFIADSSSTTGAGLTGLVFNTASLTAYYHKDTDTTATAISLVTMTVGTFTSSGFKEIDSTNMPGWYQFCPPDAAFTSAKSVGFHLKGANNMAPLPIEVDLWAVDPQVATNMGITSLPTTAVTTNASLLTSGTGTDQLSVTSGRIDAGKILGTAISTPATAGVLDVNIKNMNNVAATNITTINANQGTTQPINFTGTAGSALAKSDMVDVAGAAVSATTAQLGVNVVNWNNTVVATPATAGIPDINVKNWVNAAPNALRNGRVDALTQLQTGTAQAGGNTSITLAASASATDSIYVGQYITIDSSVGVNQTRLCTAYVGSTKVATITPAWITNPTSSSTYVVHPQGYAAAVAGDVVGNVEGNVNGSVASVTGAVGSVTGNVGGNVVGSVASVTAGVTVTTNNDKTGYTASTVSDKTGYALTSAYDFAKGTVAMTESYAAKNAALTPVQALYGINQQLGEQGISGTTMTVKKRDQSTTAKTYTLNDATTPTAITEAS